MSGVVLFGLGAFFRLAFHLTLEFFHLSFSGVTHFNYQSPATHPPCASSHIQPLQRSSTFLSSPFSPMSSTLPLPVSFLLFVSILYLSFAFSFSPLAPCLLRSYNRYCDPAALCNDWIVELIMSLNFVCDNHLGCSLSFSVCSCL